MDASNAFFNSFVVIDSVPINGIEMPASIKRYNKRRIDVCRSIGRCIPMAAETTKHIENLFYEHQVQHGNGFCLAGEIDVREHVECLVVYSPYNVDYYSTKGYYYLFIINTKNSLLSVVLLSEYYYSHQSRYSHYYTKYDRKKRVFTIRGDDVDVMCDLFENQSPEDKTVRKVPLFKTIINAYSSFKKKIRVRYGKQEKRFSFLVDDEGKVRMK